MNFGEQKLNTHSRYTSATITKKDNHLYLDTQIEYPFPLNSSQVSNGSFPDTIPAEYNQSFSEAILSNPEEYKMTIARLFIKGNGIPLMDLPANQYNVAISYDAGAGEKVFVASVPQNTGSSTLVYSVRTLVYLINQAFITAFDAAKVGIPLPAAVVKAPQLVYDPDTKQFSIYTQSEYNPDISGGNEVKVWLCQNLLSLFSCWNVAPSSPNTTFNIVLRNIDPVNVPASFANVGFSQLRNFDYGWNRVTWRWNVQSGVVDTNPVAAAPPAFSASPHDALRIAQQQGNALSSISQLAGIVISSNALSSRKESFASLIHDSSNQTISGSVFNQKSVIFDLSIDAPAESITENIVYNPTIYRWNDLLGNQPLRRVQFQMLYLFKDGVTSPVQITRGSFASIKFLFESVHKQVDHNVHG